MTTTSDIESLRKRLTAMEVRFRAASLAWLASIALIAILSVGAQQAQSQNQIIKVRGVDVVDRHGRTRISIGFGDKDNPAMWVYDDKGKLRSFFGISSSSGRPKLTLSDENEHERAYLGFAAAGKPTPMLNLADDREKDSIYLGWSTKERPIMHITDQSNNVSWVAP